MTQGLNRRAFLTSALLAAPVALFNPWSLAARPNPYSKLQPSALVKPPHLEFGDVVGVVAPASPPTGLTDVNDSLAALERLGFKPKLAPNVRQRLGFLAGTDHERAADLMGMFADPEVKAIFCLRGGYGAGRLLGLLDYQFIRRHPKILVGFSDITSLHCALLTRARMVSFHGPTLNTSLTSAEPPSFVLRSLWKTLMTPAPAGSLREGYPQNTVSILHRGSARGRLVGGNLSVLCTTLGTPCQPPFRDNILFFEEVDEDPYSIDRMLTHLLNMGVLQQVAGIAIGLNRNSKPVGETKETEFTQTIGDVLVERLEPLGVPVVTGLPFGHVRFNATLPVGVAAQLDGETGDLIIIEASVT